MTKLKKLFLIKVALSSFLIALSISLGLFLGEMFLRQFNPLNLNIHRFDPYYGYRLRKDRHIDFKSPNRSVKISTNSSGFRGPEFSSPKPTGSYRVLVLGDSMVFGNFVENQETFSATLQDSFDESLIKKMEVINVGVSGYGTDQEMAYLERELIHLEPDKIILGFFLGNDIVNNRRDRIYRIQNEKLIAVYPTYRANRLALIKSDLAAHSHLYNLLRGLKKSIGKNNLWENDYRTKGLAEITAKNASKITEMGWEKTFHLLIRMKKQCEKRRIKLQVLIIPMKEQVNPNALKKSLQHLNLDEKEIDLLLPQRKMLEFLKKNNFSYLDLTPRLVNQNQQPVYYFHDDFHLNPLGHKKVAQILFENLSGNISENIN